MLFLTLRWCVTEVSPHIRHSWKEDKSSLLLRSSSYIVPGVTWGLLSKPVSKIFQRTNLFFFFVWNCHSSGQCPSKTDITTQIICPPGTVPPPSPSLPSLPPHVLWMYTLMNVFLGCRFSVWWHVGRRFPHIAVLLFRIASSKLQPRATISMHRNWSLYTTLHNTVIGVYCVQPSK